jgi:hypothetical protein
MDHGDRGSWKRRLALALALLFLFLIAACGLSATEEVDAGTATRRPTRTASMTHTYNFPLTSTPRPPTLTSTIDATYQAWETERAATQEAQKTIVAQYPGNCSSAYSLFLVSPDENWLASNCFEDENFTVISRDGSKQWRISYQEVLDRWGSSPDYVLISGFMPYHWSADSCYVYFYIWSDPRPDVGYPYGNFDMPNLADTLYRLDTTNGIWAQFTPPANFHSFSPTGRRLVSIYANIANCQNDPCPVEIFTLDLRTGITTNFTLNNTLAAGYIVWTKDGTRFFFSTVQYSKNDQFSFDYSIYMVQTDNNSLILLQNYENMGWATIVYPIEWTENNILVIQSETYDPNGKFNFEYQYYDLSTNQFITPTPMP